MDKEKLNALFLGEDDFLKRMNEEILPFYEKERKFGELNTELGGYVRYAYIKNPNEKAAIVISHGFCEFIGKYDELAYYFYNMGYSVFMPEHHGHGYSKRDVYNIDRVSVESYEVYVWDFYEFVNEVVKKESTSGKLVLFAHSMGGAIGSMVLEKFPDLFDFAVLSSPMIDINFGGVPRFAIKLAANFMKLIGKGEEFAAGQSGFNPEEDFATSCSLSRARFDYNLNHRIKEKHFRTSGGTYNWVCASLKGCSFAQKYSACIEVPVLMVRAGQDTLVSLPAQDKFAAKNPLIEVVEVTPSKHEIFNSVDADRKVFYETIFGWLEEKLA
ncbi:MAG: alpha/beta hydrolase [Lachnospiraceae bacterium]|nr:alpha/beta hydrolase [Lachnospiraceae bacterium]